VVSIQTSLTAGLDGAVEATVNLFDTPAPAGPGGPAGPWAAGTHWVELPSL